MITERFGDELKRQVERDLGGLDVAKLTANERRELSNYIDSLERTYSDVDRSVSKQANDLQRAGSRKLKEAESYWSSALTKIRSYFK